MKTIILFTLILNTFLFSNTTFDISKVNFGPLKYNANTKMRIYKNGITAFNLPIEINSHTRPIKKTKTGYLKRSTFNINFTAIKSNKMTFSTETLTEFDNNKKLNFDRLNISFDWQDRTYTTYSTILFIVVE